MIKTFLDIILSKLTKGIHMEYVADLISLLKQNFLTHYFKLNIVKEAAILECFNKACKQLRMKKKIK